LPIELCLCAQLGDDPLQPRLGLAVDMFGLTVVYSESRLLPADLPHSIAGQTASFDDEYRVLDRSGDATAVVLPKGRCLVVPAPRN
jgi:hypothetical protein